MKALKAVAVSLALIAGATASVVAYAQHGGHGGGGHGGGWHGGGWHGGGWYGHSNVRFGVVVGGPGFWYPGAYYPYYYPPYYPYYPEAVGVPASPPVYVEQGQQAPAPSGPSAGAQAYWYYCAESNAYYPYVNKCAGRWQPVSPQPPS